VVTLSGTFLTQATIAQIVAIAKSLFCYLARQ